MNSLTSNATTNPDAVLYKTDRGYNINIALLTRTAKESIDKVRVITIPSVVRQQHRNHSEVLTLTEMGGGPNCDFCQVIAGSDGKPIGINDVVFVNSDPNKININHGTAAVAVGNYFAVGWRRNSDNTILIYRIVNTEVLVEDARTKDDVLANKAVRPIAKLTLELEGYSITSWRGRATVVPDELAALFSAVQLRLQIDIPAPIYMDVFRITATSTEAQKISEQMQNGEFGPTVDYSVHTLMINIYNEIVDIREGQYARISDEKKPRKVEALKGVQTFELDREDNTITTEILFPREDNTPPVQYRTVLTADNFLDDDGRPVLERGLLRRQATFELLKADLLKQNERIVTVSLSSIR